MPKCVASFRVTRVSPTMWRAERCLPTHRHPSLIRSSTSKLPKVRCSMTSKPVSPRSAATQASAPCRAIVITLLLSVFERRREIGLLRAVGMTRAQVRTTVRWESVITSLLGAVTGVVLGIVMGVVVVAALADDGGLTFRLPVTGTITIVVISFILGVVAAIYPAWRATKVNVVEAISTT
ncbi:MAG: FtsX-like permease family protein [Actinobacteria bacterium]|nr:FtsX-like permease family protein [Actinomycetota bacterium]